jgi:DNA-binding NtrC family response regulator
MLRTFGASDAGVEGPVLDRLLAYAWPGNVRELRNVVARATALSVPGTPFARMPIVVRPDAAPPAELLARADVPYHEAKDALLARFDREYCADALARARGNVSQAARVAGLERKYFYKVLERAGLRSGSQEAAGEGGEGRES